MSTQIQHRPPVTCFPWCAYGDGHPGQIYSQDQSCLSAERRVNTVCYPSIEQGDGTWAAEYITVYSQAWARGDRQPRLWIGVGEGREGFEVTPAEARQVAAAILNVADEMEGSR